MIKNKKMILLVIIPVALIIVSVFFIAQPNKSAILKKNATEFLKAYGISSLNEESISVNLYADGLSLKDGFVNEFKDQLNEAQESIGLSPVDYTKCDRVLFNEFIKSSTIVKDSEYPAIIDVVVLFQTDNSSTPVAAYIYTQKEYDNQDNQTEDVKILPVSISDEEFLKYLEQFKNKK